MLKDPVRAGEWGAEAEADAIAGCVDLGEVNVDFGNDARHIDALEVCVRELARRFNIVRREGLTSKEVEMGLKK